MLPQPECEHPAQAPQRSRAVLVLRPRFARVRHQPARAVPQAHGRGSAVALLPAGPARLETVELALGEQRRIAEAEKGPPPLGGRLGLRRPTAVFLHASTVSRRPGGARSWDGGHGMRGVRGPPVQLPRPGSAASAAEQGGLCWGPRSFRRGADDVPRANRWRHGVWGTRHPRAAARASRVRDRVARRA